MTYQKSSANKHAKKYDMKASLNLLIPPAVAAFLVLVATYVLTPLLVFINTPIYDKPKNLYAVVLSAFEGGVLEDLGITSIEIQFFILFVGLLSALRLFSYMFTKKTVNIYYSSPVDRRTMFSNRIISAVLVSSAAVAIPIIIDVIMNICYLGNAGYMLYGGLFLFLITEAYFLVGFAIGTFAAAISHTILQWFLSTPALLTLPSGLILLVDVFCKTYLRGYNHMSTIMHLSTVVEPNTFSENLLYYQASFLNPLSFGRRLGGRMYSESIMTFFCRNLSEESNKDYSAIYTTNYGAEYLTADYIIPVVLWIAIVAVTLLAARWLCINRKVEKSGILGSTMVSAHLSIIMLAVHSVYLVFAFLNVSILAVDVSDGKRLAVAFACVPLIFLCYYLLISLLGRSFKPKPKFLLAPAGMSAVMLVLALTLNAGLFGYSTYTPDVDDIKFAVVGTTNVEMTASDANNNYTFYDVIFSENCTALNTLGIFTDKKDLKALTTACCNAAKKSDDMSGGKVVVYYKLKNGKEIHRAFSNTDRQAQQQVLALRDTETYRQELQYLLYNNNADSAKKRTGDDIIDSCFDVMGEEMIADAIATGVAKITSESCQTDTVINNTPELREAIYKDLTAISFAERESIDEKPLGILIFSRNYYDKDDYDYNEAEYDSEDLAEVYNTASYYIYPYMTNVINYLKSTGEYKAFTDNFMTENAVSVTTLEVDKVIDNQNKHNDFYKIEKDKVDYSFNYLVEYPADDEDIYYDEYIHCDELFEGGKTVTDKDEMERLISTSSFHGNAKGKSLILIKCKDRSIVRLLDE